MSSLSAKLWPCLLLSMALDGAGHTAAIHGLLGDAKLCLWHILSITQANISGIFPSCGSVQGILFMCYASEKVTLERPWKGCTDKIWEVAQRKEITVQTPSSARNWGWKHAHSVAFPAAADNCVLSKRQDEVFHLFHRQYQPTDRAKLVNLSKNPHTTKDRRRNMLEVRCKEPGKRLRLINTL